MKTFKKIFTAIVAFVMSLCLALCAACGSGTTDDDNKSATGSNTTDSSSGGNSSTGNGTATGGNGTATGGDDKAGAGDNGEKVVGYTLSSEAAKQVVSALQSQQYASLNATANASITNRGDRYTSDIDGNILADAVKDGYTINTTTGATINLDLATLDYDATSSRNTTYSDFSGYYDYDEVQSQFENSSYYSYEFIRGWKSFYTSSEEEITDFGEAEFYYTNDMLASMPTMVQSILASTSLLTGEQYVINQVLMVPVVLADAYDALTVEGDVVTIDLNKVIYGLYADLNTLIDSVTVSTTVDDVIQSNLVKNLINAWTYGIDVYELYNAAKQVVASNASYAAMFNYLPAAEEGETVYTYLVKVLDSGEVSTLVASLTGITALGITNFGSMKISAIVALVYENKDAIADLFTSHSSSKNENWTDENSVETQPGESDVNSSNGNTSPENSETVPKAAVTENDTYATLMLSCIDMFKSMLEDKVDVSETALSIVYQDEADTTTGESYYKDNTDITISGAKIAYTISNGKITSIGMAYKAEYTSKDLYAVYVDSDEDVYRVDEQKSVVEFSASLSLNEGEANLTDISNGIVRNANESSTVSLSDGSYNKNNFILTVSDGQISSLMLLTAEDLGTTIKSQYYDNEGGVLTVELNDGSTLVCAITDIYYGDDEAEVEIVAENYALGTNTCYITVDVESATSTSNTTTVGDILNESKAA